MKLSKLTLLLATLAFMLPTVAIGSDIDVKTNNVRASTYSDGSVYVRTGNTRVHLPPRRSSVRWYPWRFWRLPWRSNCQNSVYQRTTQTTQSGGKVVSSSTSTSSHSCR